jgi:hypothetical protein
MITIAKYTWYGSCDIHFLYLLLCFNFFLLPVTFW